MLKIKSKLMILFAITLIIILKTNYSQASMEEVSLSVSSSSASIGDEVIIDIKLDNSSSFASANFVLNYDTSSIEYISHTNGEVLQCGAMSILKNNSETGKIAIGYVGDPNNAGEIIQSGNIAKITFKIKANSKSKVDLELQCTSLKDDLGNEIKNKITNGQIKIICEDKELKEEPKEEEKDQTQSNTIIPNAGIFEKKLIIISILISISFILYKKYTYISQIS